MLGVSRHTGQPISEREHIAQSVVDILTTPKGSRVLARNYGSEIPRLIDQPMTPARNLDLFAEAIDALRQEPRITTRRVHLDGVNSGHQTLTIDAVDQQGRPLTFEALTVSAAT